MYQSNYWYNDGLNKAQMRDMSGAIVSLRRSLQYNRENIAARNLLGLVYYGRGEVAEGLVEWIISKNFKQKDNVANYFIEKVQESPSELEAINQAVKKYNQCLLYCAQDGEDLAAIQLKKVVSAHPTFLKAYQLLALLYLRTEQYAKARQTLRTARKLDTTNEMTLRYMHEMTQLRGKKLKEDKEPSEEAVEYSLGNETIIQPISATVKEVASQVTIANILIGILIGAALIWFLVVPAVDEAKADKLNRQVVQFGDEIAAKDAQISAQSKALDEYRATNDKAEAAQQTAASTSESYENLMIASERYNSGYYSDADIAEPLLSVTRNALGGQGQALYDQITGSVFPSLCQSLYTSAVASIEVANYAPAIDNLSRVVRMDEGYEEGNALLQLAKAYAGNKDVENANLYFNRVIERFPDTDIAAEAQQSIVPEESNSESEETAAGADGAEETENQE